MNRIVPYGIAAAPLSLLLYRVIGGVPYFGTVNDLPEYSTAARLMLAGQAGKIYRLPEFFAAQTAQFPALGSRNVGLFLPPLDVPLLLPIALIPDDMAPVVWLVFLFAVLCVALWMFKRFYGLNSERFLWFVGLTMLSGPCVEAVRIGQLAPILLLCMGVMGLLVTRGRLIAAGLVFSLMVLKPQQMWPLLVFLAGARQYRMLAATLAVVIVLAAVSVPLFGVSGYCDYVSTINDPKNLDFMAPVLNATVRGQLLRLLGATSHVPNLAAIGCLLASTVFSFLLGRRAGKRADWLVFGFMGALPLGLVTSMHCHDYDLLLLVPAMVPVFSHEAFRGKPPVLQLLALLMVIMFAQPIYSEIHYQYLCFGPGVSPLNPYFFLLLIFALVCAHRCWLSAADA